MNSDLNVVTGAFGFTGSYIAERLLAAGQRVLTLTGHPENPSHLRGRIEVAALDFENPQRLARSLEGARVLYNTYWIRFPWGGADHDLAVENSKLLLRAAEEAGVERIVHLSVTNPSLGSRLPYFHGKALVEEFVRDSRLSHAIIRPALVYGVDDLLLNNIAWMLRRYPLFAIAGDGSYRLQPIFAGDLADFAYQCSERADSFTRDAVGPDIYSYRGLVEEVRASLGSASRIVYLKKWAVMAASWLLGHVVNDVILTEDELKGLMSNLLVSAETPVGKTSLRAWLKENAQHLGKEYVSELDRHYRRADVLAA